MSADQRRISQPTAFLFLNLNEAAEFEVKIERWKNGNDSDANEKIPEDLLSRSEPFKFRIKNPALR